MPDGTLNVPTVDDPDDQWWGPLGSASPSRVSKIFSSIIWPALFYNGDMVYTSYTYSVKRVTWSPYLAIDHIISVALVQCPHKAAPSVNWGWGRDQPMSLSLIIPSTPKAYSLHSFIHHVQYCRPPQSTHPIPSIPCFHRWSYLAHDYYGPCN